MFTTGPDLPQKSFRIKQDDKFFSRLLSKESSMANPSFRVYYGELSVAVPFMWESQPGTPKDKLCENTLPPLTPPPSHSSASYEKPIKKHSRSTLLRTFFPRITIKKAGASAFSTNSASLSPRPGKYWARSPGSLFDSGAYDEDPPFGSPTSTLCFSTSYKGNGGRFRGCYGWSS